MAIERINIVKYTCDRCLTATDGTVGRFADGVILKGEYWGTGHDGGMGGATVSHLLCGRCTDELRSFLKGA